MLYVSQNSFFYVGKLLSVAEGKQYRVTAAPELDREVEFLRIMAVSASDMTRTVD